MRFPFCRNRDSVKNGILISIRRTGDGFHPGLFNFASLLEKFEDPIVNSFIMVEKIGNGKIYDAHLSNGPIESINRKVKDLKRLGRGFRNFEHFRNRFLFATRQTPVLDGVTDHNPVTYYEDDDF